MAGEKVNKDVKIQKFITDVMQFAESRVVWHINNNPLINGYGFPRVCDDHGDHNAEVNEARYRYFGPKDEPRPPVGTPASGFRGINSKGGEITAAALATIFQAFAWQLTRYRRVRLRRTATGSGTSTTIGPSVAAMQPEYRMAIGTFRTYVNNSPNIVNLAPGNLNSEQALDSLIATLRNIIDTQTSTTSTYMDIAICHSSCHSSCHGNRTRR